MPEPVFQELLEHRRSAEFRDHEASDGVVYPRVCDDVPRSVVDFLTVDAGRPPDLLFLRESPAGVEVPHIVHADHLMGETAMMLYLEQGPDGAGTSFMRHHLLGVSWIPKVPALAEMVAGDQNRPERWIAYAHCTAVRNRVCFFNTGWFHSAMPVGGYGEGREARCVLTAFWR